MDTAIVMRDGIPPLVEALRSIGDGLQSVAKAIEEQSTLNEQVVNELGTAIERGFNDVAVAISHLER